MDIGTGRHAGQSPVGYVIQIPVHLEYPREGYHFLAVCEDIGVYLAGGEAAWHGDEVVQGEQAFGLVHDAVNHVGYSRSLHGVEGDVASHVGQGLEHKPPYGGMAQAELEQGAHFVVINAALNRGNQGHIQVCLSKPVQGLELGLQQVFSPYELVS